MAGFDRNRWPLSAGISGHFGPESLAGFVRNMHKAHCSGHAGKSDLEYAIKTINPDILIPIHTQNPEEFKKIHDDVRIVRRGETVKI